MQLLIAMSRILIALLAFASLGAAAGVVGRALPALDILADLAAIFAIVGVAGLALALIARRWRSAVVAGLGVLASATLILPEFTRDAGPVAAPGAAGRLKVIQINPMASNADIGRVADWLTDESPDIVTITEARHDLRDVLIQRGWSTAGAHSDLMIFTPAPYIRMTRPRAEGAPTFVNATYASSSGPLEVFTTHLDRRLDRGAPPLLELAGLAASRPRERMILTGDFNATPWSSRLRAFDRSLGLTRRGRAVATWPAQVAGVRWPFPFAAIDHVYAGPGWATVKVERGPWVGSDHYPLIVTLAPVLPR